MKKLLIIFLMTMFHLSHVYSQSAYTDSKYLDARLDPSVGNKILLTNDVKQLLLIYFPNQKINDLNRTFLDKQPFLNGLFVDQGAGALDKSQFSAAVNSIANTNVANLASGITSFLVKRAKEELLISVINKIKDPKEFPEIQLLFPNTIKLMNSFESWDYANVLNTLKVAFDQDLQQLLGDLPKLNTLKPADYTGSVKTRVGNIISFLSTPEARIFLSAMQIGDGIIIGEKVPDIINKISGVGFLGDYPGANQDINNFIKTFNIISYSLRSPDDGKNYISTSEFNTITSDAVLKNLYLGLLSQQFINANLQFGNLDIAKIIAFAQSLITQGDALNTAMANLSKAKKAKEKDMTTYWAAVFDSLKSFLESSTSISQIDATLKFPTFVSTILDDVSKTFVIADDISNRNYSNAVFDLTNFIPDNKTYSKFKGFILKYGSFAANLVQAKNADDAENAIEAVALPVGSYSVKQNSTWNISVNGYIGYGKDGNYASGIYAPIGFSASTSNLGGLCNCQVPITLFVPIFDVGSIAQYQLNNPTTTGTSTTGTPTGTSTTASTINTSSSNQQIKLGSIFAPGVELLFEYPKWPFAFGAGYRRTPTLSYSSGSTYTTVGARWEVNFTILIDIPIFTLLNRSKD